MRSSESEKLEGMTVERKWFGHCNIGHFIYVLGGGTNSNERFNVISRRWNNFGNFPTEYEYALGVAVVTARNRYLFSFGGYNTRTSE